MAVPDDRDGPLLLHMQFTDTSWLHRRVDRVEFISDSLCRHHVSCDFDVQDAAVIQSAKVNGTLPAERLLCRLV